MTDGCIFKGRKRNFFSLRDQCETTNIFKGPKYQLSLIIIIIIITTTIIIIIDHYFLFQWKGKLSITTFSKWPAQ